MIVLICGGGKVGYSLARHLANKRYAVVIIEKDKAKCERIAGILRDVIVIHGDACEPRYLEEAQAGRAKVLVALTGHDEDNLVICQVAKTCFSVPRTVAKVNDPRNEEALAKLGVDVLINATDIIAQLIDKEVDLEDISTLLKYKEGKISVVQGIISQQSPLVGKQLKDLSIPPKCIIASVVRGEDIIVPQGDTVLQGGDNVLAIVTAENEKAFRRLLKGG
ncbi:MAG: TrkA family potassium uptake protein [Candidatus Aureabacteria bacterium]|nr:TrkA family potassium uptake protein [Candidatus Auribacterota bacterium]